ncbi:putative LRR receptor-like serine/threonine-protein kinase At1g51820 [Tasmannia lanceolata]|uniref:putative LRR receptor-like serine/threonine-protein kinase At1g51820 n=1 Tax=Tasmannia lanceolata TaxID=3420 RepID=UPI0040634D37
MEARITTKGQRRRFPDDEHHRIWDPTTPIGFTNISADYKSLSINAINEPPFEVISTMIEARRPLDPIILAFNTSQIDLRNYVILYFAESFKLQSNQSRSFDIYFNGNYNQTLSPRYMICDVIDGLGDGIFNLTLIPSNFSNLPPIISAMELFNVRDVVVEQTSEEDLQGLSSITILSDRLDKMWTGDPCLPANAPWQWLRCNDDNPPRVTALYLAGYELTGYLLIFITQMEALEIIDLHNNSLMGTIPNFLGELPNLKELNLADNKFEGSIPESLLNNQKLSLNVSGNPGLKFPKKKRSPVVGLSAGGALLFVAICLVIAYFVRSSRRRMKIQEIQPGGTGEAQPIPHDQHGN